MASLYQHPTEKAFLYQQSGSKKIYMSYYDALGRRRQKTTGTDDLETAKVKLQETLFLLKAEQDGTITLNNDKTSSVAFIARQLIKETEISKQPQESYKEHIRKLKEIAETYPTLDVRDLRRREMAKLMAIPRSLPQHSYLKASFKRIFEYAEDERIISGVPSFPKPTIKPFTKTRFPITDSQFYALIGYMEEIRGKSKTEVSYQNKGLLIAFMMILRHTGARFGEVRALRRKNYVFDGKNHFLSIHKSKTIERRILIPSAASFVLEMILHNKKPNDYLFARWCDGKLPNFTNIMRELKKHHKDFFEKNDLQDFVLYNLRHTFITQKLKEGKNTFYVAQHCGTSVEMIETHYADHIVASNFNYVYTDEEKVEVLSVDDLRKKHEEMTKKGA